MIDVSNGRALAVAGARWPRSRADACAFAQAPAERRRAPLTGEAAAIKKLLEQKFPGAEVQQRHQDRRTSASTRCMLDDRIVYTDAKVDVHLRRRDVRHGDRSRT